MSGPITVDVYAVNTGSPTSALTHIDVLSSDSGLSWLDDPETPGSFSLAIKAGHADEALLTPGRLLRFSINGTPVWWGLIEPRSKVSADPTNREGGRIVTVKGGDAIAILEKARVNPEAGVGSFCFTDTRNLGWMSAAYNDSLWDNAVQLKQVSDVDPTKPWFLSPNGHPDADGWWVGPPNGDDPAAWDPVGVPAGSIYFRGTLTIGSGDQGEYVDYITGDDGFKLYRNSEAVLARQEAGLWGEIQKTEPTMLDFRTHQYAVELINFDRPSAATNVTGLVYSVLKLEDGGAWGQVVGRSSSGTKMLAFPDNEPGLTPGHILKLLIDEAHARGAILPLHYDFDETNDSAGTPWPKEVNIEARVGGRVLEVAQKLQAMGVVRLRIKPDSTTLTLQAFSSLGDDLSGSVEAEYAVNIGALGHTGYAPEENALLTKGSDNRWVEFTDDDAIDDWGRIEGALDAGSAASGGSVADQALAYLADHAQPAEVVDQLRIEPVNARPYVDFVRGDIITAPAYDGTPASFRVTGIKVSQDAAGQPIYDLNLETP